MKKNINKNKDCAICYQIPMSLSPEGWRHLEEWHDNGHPNNEVNVTTTCNLDEKKCEHLHVTNWICDKCGVDTLRERRSEVLSPSDKTWEESLNLITVDIWANIHDSLKKDGAKFKGDGIGTAYRAWVALNEIFIPRTKDLLTSATIKAKEDTIRDMYKESGGMIVPDFIEKYALSKGINLEEPNK